MSCETRTDGAGNIYFCVTMTDRTGGGETKMMEYEDFLAMLKDSGRMVEDNTYIPIGNLPAGFIDGKLLSSGEGGVALLYVPPHKGVFLLEIAGDRKEPPQAFHIPYPAAVFEITYGERGKTSGKVWCTKYATAEGFRKAYWGKRAKKYCYPFANVDRNGSICMGNIARKVDRMEDAPKYIGAFFDGISSHHYMDQRKYRPDMTQAELLKELDGLEKFPNEYLLSCRELF